MLNKKPIFILGFQYGGSNILLNLLRSHPKVCSPRGEIQEVFKGKGFPRPKESIPVMFSKLWGYLPIFLSQKQDIFSLDLWEKRHKFSENTIERVDKILFNEKFKAREPSQNKYKSQEIEYTMDEIIDSRLLCKILNGNIFLTDMLYNMYPDAVFIALVRNGFALCEGNLRRGHDVRTISQFYEKGCQKMISDEIRITNYHIIKFEDILDRPIESMKKIYDFAALDMNEVKKVRLETKKMVTNDGKHEHIHGVNRKQVIWYDLESFYLHLQKDVTTNQIKRLTEDQKELIKQNAFNSLKYFDYINVPT